MMLVKSQRGEIGGANLEKRLFSLECRAPIERLTKKRRADSAATPVRPHGEVKNFEIACDAARHDESCDFVFLLRCPSGHIALHNARVVSSCPLRDFGTRGLYRHDKRQVARFDRASAQVYFGAFQWSSASVRRT